MSLFKKKKVEESTSSCCGCCSETCETSNDDEVVTENGVIVSIKVLGSGCAKCNELETNVKAALLQLSIEVEVEHVTDFVQIAAMGVMSTPALVINDEVVSSGKVLKKDDVIAIIQKITE